MYQEDNCPICLEKFQNDQYILEECKHWMHKSCIENTFAPAKCPICKISLTSVSVRPAPPPEDISILPDDTVEYVTVDATIIENMMRRRENKYVKSVLDTLTSVDPEDSHEFIENDIEFANQLLYKKRLNQSEMDAFRDMLHRFRRSVRYV